MRKVRISKWYVGPLCGDCVHFCKCRAKYGIAVRDRPCSEFDWGDGR